MHTSGTLVASVAAGYPVASRAVGAARDAGASCGDSHGVEAQPVVRIRNKTSAAQGSAAWGIFLGSCMGTFLVLNRAPRRRIAGGSPIPGLGGKKPRRDFSPTLKS